MTSEPHPPPVATTGPPPSHKKILVVDDDPRVCATLRVYLNQHGYEVFESHQGDAAISLVHTHHPDLILLDVVLPGSLDGVQVYHRLKGKSSTQNIPVIFITATQPGWSVTEQELPLGERCSVVGKPFELDAILREIQRLLAG